MAKIPDRTEHQRLFMALDLAERRAIIRAVNRGRAVEVRKHAPLAIGVARRQQRFWKYGWLVGPAMGVVQIAFVPLEAALLNAAFGTLAIGLVSWFWLSRARRSEALNLEIVERRRRPGDSEMGNEGASTSRRLPWRRSRSDDSSPGRRSTVGAGDSSQTSGKPSSGGHLPSRSGARPTGDRAAELRARQAPLPETLDPVRRPYRPRRRKRRNKG